jgi:hypothetical protein
MDEFLQVRIFHLGKETGETGGVRQIAGCEAAHHGYDGMAVKAAEQVGNIFDLFRLLENQSLQVSGIRISLASEFGIFRTGEEKVDRLEKCIVFPVE